MNAAVPTALKIARGNPGKRPLPKDEPKVEPGVPEKPAGLDAYASKQWDRLVILLQDMKVLTPKDGIDLANLCRSMSRLRRAEQQFRKGGSRMAVQTRTGGLASNPLIRIIQAETAIQDKLCQQFGMTPSSRTKVRVVGGSPATADPWDEFEAHRPM